MHALITNDDGIDSPGLHALAGVAADAGLDALIAAPAVDRSGASASLASVQHEGRVVITRHEIGPAGVDSVAVEAAPAFIVHAAMAGAFGPPPDVVLSGINRGPNTGHSILHSGTVGAAFTASHHGRWGLAVSSQAWDESGIECAVAAAGRALAWLLQTPAGTVVNINTPACPAGTLRGLRRARLAAFGAVEAQVHERGEGWVTLTYADVDADHEPDTDAALLAAGFATCTVLRAVQEDAGVDVAALEAWRPSDALGL